MIRSLAGRARLSKHRLLAPASTGRRLKGGQRNNNCTLAGAAFPSCAWDQEDFKGRNSANIGPLLLKIDDQQREQDVLTPVVPIRLNTSGVVVNDGYRRRRRSRLLSNRLHHRYQYYYHHRYFSTQVPSDEDEDDNVDDEEGDNHPPPSNMNPANPSQQQALTRSAARKMRVAQLRVELANRGLETQGTKPELLERLLSSSINLVEDQRGRKQRRTKESAVGPETPSTPPPPPPSEEDEEEAKRKFEQDDDSIRLSTSVEERLLSALSSSLTTDDLESLTGKKVVSSSLASNNHGDDLEHEQPTTTTTTTPLVTDDDRPLDIVSFLSKKLDNHHYQQQLHQQPTIATAPNTTKSHEEEDGEDTGSITAASKDAEIIDYNNKEAALFSMTSSSSTTLDLDGVKSSFEEALERLLQSDYPPKIKAHLVAEVLTHWSTWLSYYYQQQQQQQQQSASSTTSPDGSDDGFFFFKTDDVVNKIWEYQKRLPDLPLWWNRRSYDSVLASYTLEQQHILRGGGSSSSNSNNTNNNRHQQQLAAAVAVADKAKSFLIDGIVKDLQDRGGGAVSSDDDVGPNSKNFQTLIDLYINAEDLDGAMIVLEWLLDKRRNDQCSRIDGLNFHQLRIDQTVFQRLLQCCVDFPLMSVRRHRHDEQEKQEPHRGIMADDIFNTLQRFHKHGILGGRVQMEHFTQVVNAWAKSGDPRSVKRAMKIWNHLKTGSNKRHRRNDPLAPDAILTNTVLDTLARQGQAELAMSFMQTILSDKKQKLLRPNIAGFNAVLNAWSKSKKIYAGERAERLLRFMQKEFSLGDVQSYACVIQAWGASNHPKSVERAKNIFEEMLAISETDPAMEPTTVTYVAMLNCYAKAGDVPNASRLLVSMCTDYSNGKSVKAIPDEQCFATVMDAIARSKQRESGVAAEALLRKMESSNMEGGVGPISYNIVINAWAKSGRKDAGVNAERLLREMQTKFADGNTRFKPRLDTYNAVMNAWNLSHSAGDAERLLRELQQMGDKPSFFHMKPDRLSYHAVMHAHARDGNPHRNDALLAEMTKQGKSCEPSPETLKLCLEAWARSGRADSGKSADMYLARLDREHARIPLYLKEWCCKLALSAWLKTMQHGNQPAATQRYETLSAELRKIQNEKEKAKARSRSKL